MRALLFSIRRWAQTSGKIAATSSGMTKSRPLRYAYAFAIRQTASAPRGLTPSATCGWVRVFFHERGHIVQNGVAHIHFSHVLHQSQQFFLVDHGVGTVKGIIHMAVAENVDAALVVR